MEKVIFSLLGPPGAGKGTLAQLLKASYGVSVLSTGALCRKQIELKTKFGNQFDYCIRNNLFIPDELITMLVAEWMEVMVQQQVSIVLDGFPRTQGQAQLFFEFLKKRALFYRFRVIVLELELQECMQRLNRRRICSNKDCQKSCDGRAFDSVCPLCGNALIKRDDDKNEIICERLKRYPRHKDDLITFYVQIGQLVEELDVRGLRINQVFNRFRAIL